MLIRMLLILNIVSLAVAQSACEQSKGKKKKGKIQRIFVHGDPLKLISDSSFDSKTPFSKETADNFADFNLYGGRFFTKASAEANRQTAEEGNETSNQSSSEHTSSIDHYSFQIGESDAQYISEDKDLSVNFDIDEQGDFVFRSITFEDTDVDLELLHYSVKNDGTAFSLLLKGDNEHYRGLMALMFTKNSKESDLFSKESEEFQYLLGSGIAAGWTENINAKVCGKMSQTEERALNLGIDGWNKPLGDISKNLTVARIEQDYPPFSDLNTNCVRMVDDYFFEDQSEFVVLGLALTTIELNSRRIIASNILVSRAGLKKSGLTINSKKYETVLSYTSGHEFGHSLGLGHEFSRSEDGKQKYESLMSYGFDNVDDPKPREHDISALHAIYE